MLRPIFLAAISSASAMSRWEMAERIETLEAQQQEKALVKPDLKQQNVFSVTGEFLYWHIQENGLNYVIETQTTTLNSFDRGQVKKPDFEWNPGFRVGVGYRMPRDKWAIDALWTWIRTDATNRVHEPEDGFLYPVWTLPSTGIHPTTASPVTEANVRWKTHLNVVDLELSRYFKVTQQVSLTPHIGLRGAWISQRYSTHFKGGATSVAVLQDSIKLTNHFKGIGLRGGLNTEWTFWKNWSLFGNAGFSFLYGPFNVKQRENYQPVTISSSIVVSNLKDDFHSSVTTGDIALGIRWDRMLYDNRYAICFDLGWEYNTFFSLNQFKHFVDATSPGANVSSADDLTMQGLVASARFDF